jgi:hypothetical protein
MGIEDTMKGRAFPGIAFLTLAGSSSFNEVPPADGRVQRTAVFLLPAPAAFLAGVLFRRLSRLRSGSAGDPVRGGQRFFSVAGASASASF